MPETSPHVVVVGAGLGGLAAALALLRRGIDTDVYEQAPTLGEIGAGVQISANGTAVLFALGLEAQVRQHGVQVADKEIRLWNSGQTWSLFGGGGLPGGGRYAFPMFTMHRKDLHAMLVRAVRERKAEAIHLDRRCVGFREHGSKVEVEFERGASVTGDLLIGADGLHSRIRKQLFGEMTATFTGQVVWRGLIPIEAMALRERRLVGTNWVGPNAHVTCYPVQRGEMFNFVGQVDRTDWQIESWVTEGTREECMADFSGWHADVHRMIENSSQLYKWGLFLREPLDRWSVGRATLLGDAAHAMLPYLGQGANMALEDGLVLARCIESSRAQPEAALRRYEVARRERASEVVRASAAMAGTFHSAEMADSEGAQRYVQTQWNQETVRARYDWIYQYDANQVGLERATPAARTAPA